MGRGQVHENKKGLKQHEKVTQNHPNQSHRSTERKEMFDETKTFIFTNLEFKQILTKTQIYLFRITL